LSFVTIHPALNMTTRLVGPHPQRTTLRDLSWPLRPDTCRANASAHTPVPSCPFFDYINILQTQKKYTILLAYAEADNTRNTGPIHTSVANVLGMGVSAVVVICHTSVRKRLSSSENAGAGADSGAEITERFTRARCVCGATPGRCEASPRTWYRE